MFKSSANANIPVLLFQFVGYPVGFFMLIAEGLFNLNFWVNISLVLSGSLLLLNSSEPQLILKMPLEIPNSIFMYILIEFPYSEV